VNCHATTETSDLIGGLRPVRGRDVMQRKILNKLKNLIVRWPYKDLLQEITFPKGLCLEDLHEGDPPFLEIDENEETDSGTSKAPEVGVLVSLARSIFKARPSTEQRPSEEDGERSSMKRRKLTPLSSPRDCDDSSEDDIVDSLTPLVEEIEELGRRYTSLFEWSDGPLVHAMKAGQMLLLDEMSLAEDAVLERLNSVLEPSRTLVLAEKGDDGSETESRVIVASDGFRIFATMNPGGDFGKRELSPALRSRFTEIWVPPVKDRSDFELVLGRTLVPRSMQTAIPKSLPVLGCMLAYVAWFNERVCGDPSSPYSGYSLTLRDILSWARFIVESRQANKELGLWEAYCHGACLMHLDGLGLGTGLALEDSSSVRTKAEAVLLDQVPEGNTVSNIGGADESFETQNSGTFGAFPFYITVGPLSIPEARFNMAAPTTSLNTFRVLRAMQLRKPVLLEGSPGVGKTR
jgi:midasin